MITNKNSADRVIASANEKASAVLDGRSNWIQAHTEDDRKHVTLTMFIGGERAAWIEFDAEQLDEVIRACQTCRAEIT